MFLQVFSKKVCFCCILGCFAEKKLPQISQILTDGACLEFCEFCVLWEYSSPTDCTDQHRWLVALMVAWVRQGCHTLLHLCKSVKSVGDPSLQEASVQICEICGRKLQQEGSVNSVGGNHSKKAAWVWQGCHTLLHLYKSVLSVGDPSLQEGSVQICEICRRKSQREGSVNSVKSVGENRSKKAAWVWQGCHTLL